MPFAGPEQVLAYLARYTHRVAIANSRLVSIDDDEVAFRWKDYRQDGDRRRKVMTLDAGEFIRRFLLHVLPDGFHRIRHYGFLANGHRADKLALCRKLLDVTADAEASAATGGDDASVADPPSCPCCGGRMRSSRHSSPEWCRAQLRRSSGAIRHEPDPQTIKLARASSKLVIGRRHTGAHDPSLMSRSRPLIGFPASAVKPPLSGTIETVPANHPRSHARHASSRLLLSNPHSAECVARGFVQSSFCNAADRSALALTHCTRHRRNLYLI